MAHHSPHGVTYRCVRRLDDDSRPPENPSALVVEDDLGQIWICVPIKRDDLDADALDDDPLDDALAYDDDELDDSDDEAAVRIVHCDDPDDLPATLVAGPSSHDEASYFCDACGEEIVIPIDLSAGEHQQYVEDCPVCCRPNVIHVELSEDGGVEVWGEAEG